MILDRTAKPILIVEDNPAIRQMQETAFKESGFLVKSVSDGQLAYNLLTSMSFLAVILDLKTPHKDGLTLLKELQQLDQKLDTGPIIVYSSVEFSYAQEEAINLGAAAFIEKGALTPLELVAKVTDLLHQSV